MVMRAGRLRDIVDIKEKVVTRNEAGEEIVSWATIANGESIWASVEPMSGKEYFEATQLHADLNTQIIMRYVSGVKADMRVHHGDDVYQIVSPPIDKYSRRESLQLMCKRVDPAVTP